MAKMIPPIYDREKTSPGEIDVFNKLKNDIEATDWIILHSLDIADPSKRLQGESDFVIIVPEKGILVTEVKSVRSFKRESGIWYLGTNPPDHRGPFKQSSEFMHDLIKKVFKEKPHLSHLLFWSAVIFTEIDFNEKSIEWDDWQIIDRDKLQSRSLSRLILEIFNRAKRKLTEKRVKWFDRGSNDPTLSQCNEIAQFLRPMFEIYQSPNMRSARLVKDLKYYTEEQYRALDEMEENDNVLFKGPAGTGKTLLAIEAARRSYEKGRRVLFVCFNRELSKWLIKQLKPLSENVICSTLHKYMLDLTGIEIPEDTENFWKDELPSIAIDKLLANTEGNNLFDEIIIDEAPDLIVNKKYLDFLDLCLSNKGGLRSGTWKFFGDFEKQVIYDKNDNPIEIFEKYLNRKIITSNLRINCRNTPRVAKFAENFGGLEPGYRKILRPDDEIIPEYILYTDHDHQEIMFVESLNNLHEQGYSKDDIIILSPKADKRCCASQIKNDFWRSKLRPFRICAKGHIHYCTIHAFKGLEKPAVIVTDMDLPEKEIKQSLLYIAITRTQQKLIIFAKS